METESENLYRGPQQSPAKPKKKRTGATPARRFAVETNALVRERRAFAHEVLESRLKKSKLSKEDKAFAQVLVLGVAATWGTLDEIINMTLHSPSDIEDDVRDALRISAYEILFLGKEDHAAVDQGVELAKYVAPRTGGLANATLRRVVKLKASFPFGDPKTDVSALARLFGFPQWLAVRLIKDLGASDAVALMKASNEQAPLFVAVNSVKATDKEIVALFADCGVEAAPQMADGVAVPGCYFIPNGKILLDGRISHALAQGKILVSDLSAQRIAQIALPAEKPARFLEIGAGRGTKTILLQSDAQRKYGSQMNHVTVDNYAFKARLLKERAVKYGIEVDDAAVYDATTLSREEFPEGFDAVFIDAPCSGLGTLRRHPEIRWRLSEKGIEDLAQTGLAMLKAAAGLVNPGGQLTYSTCTVTKRENTDVVLEFLKSQEGAAFKLQAIDGHASFTTNVNSGSADGHFAVCLVRGKE
ncbi:MAG: transcription antitermination factor NusB [Eggerthellales bacterium]|nr:transcription antitermination factor NusB [Eggerthellales bacterium]